MKTKRTATWLMLLALITVPLPSYASLINNGAEARNLGEVVVRVNGVKDMKQLNLKIAAIRLVFFKQLNEAGLKGVEPLSVSNSKAFMKVRFEKDSEISNVMEALSTVEGVQYVEPNFRVSTNFGRGRGPTLGEILEILIPVLFPNPGTPNQPVPAPLPPPTPYHPVAPAPGTVPNDKSFAQLWGISNTGQAVNGQTGKAGADINVLPVWQSGHVGRQNITVAVIDTGVDWAHPDLRNNLWENPREAGANARNGKDDDGNGLIDDVNGWDFVRNSTPTTDNNEHGTHVAGTIGAMGNNGQGVTGINFSVKIMPVNFLDKNGSGSTADGVKAIQYAVKMGAKIMNMSWGSPSRSQALEDAIREAQEAGVLAVVAAGNDAQDNDTHDSYPANIKLDNVISVAAIDNRGDLASFSNYGEDSVHIAAPGWKILSTTPNGNFKVFSGTSMATPHVAGVAALLWSAYPNLTYRDVKRILMECGTRLTSLTEKIISGSMINAEKAILGSGCGR